MADLGTITTRDVGGDRPPIGFTIGNYTGTRSGGVSLRVSTWWGAYTNIQLANSDVSGVISGVILENAVPVARQVLVYETTGRVLVGAAFSDASGNYTVGNLSKSETYLVVKRCNPSITIINAECYDLVQPV